MARLITTSLDTISLSPMIGFDGSVFVTPTFAPFDMVADPDKIIPPTMFNVGAVKSRIGPYNIGTTMLLPNDIYVPSFSVMGNALNLYNDVCDTPSIREKVTKIIYYKLLDKWLYNKLMHLLGYLTVSDGKVRVISDPDKPDDYKKNTQDEIDKKVDYIENHVLSIGDVYAILQRFSEGTRVSWCELPKETFFVRESIEKSLEKKLKRMVAEK